MNDSKQRRGRVTIGCSRRQARLGLFGACITALVLASRSLFLGGLGHSGGGRDVLAAVQRAAGGMGGMGGMLMGTSRRKSSPSRLPLFDALVVYDAAAGPGEEKGAPGEKKKGANDQAKAVALTSAAAVDARGGIVPILVVAGCRPRMLRRALLSASVDEISALRGDAARPMRAARPPDQCRRAARRRRWPIARSFRASHLRTRHHRGTVLRRGLQPRPAAYTTAANRRPVIDPRTPPCVVVRGLRLGTALLLGLEIQLHWRRAHPPAPHEPLPCRGPVHMLLLPT